MARAGKVGIDYFSHDTNMISDNKIRFIRAKHGLMGYAVFLRLIEDIYSENGYFLKADDKFNILFASDNNLDLNVYILILNDCIEEGLFNKELYDEYKILTSKRIQSNYIAATVRRNNIYILKEYLLLSPEECKVFDSKCKIHIKNLNDNILGLNDNILPLKTIIGTQKEKEKEKENNNKNTLVCDDEFEKFWLLYDKKVGKPICIKKWNKISKENKELIFKKLPAYIKSTPDKQYRKDPATWLNQECWNDELIERDKTTETSGDDNVIDLVMRSSKINRDDNVIDLIMRSSGG